MLDSKGVQKIYKKLYVWQLLAVVKIVKIRVQFPLYNLTLNKKKMKDKIYLLAIALFVITFILCYFEPLCTNEAFVFITLLSGFNAVVWTFATFDKLKENE